jgi:hypothetical protein
MYDTHLLQMLEQRMNPVVRNGLHYGAYKLGAEALSHFTIKPCCEKLADIILPYQNPLLLSKQGYDKKQTPFWKQALSFTAEFAVSELSSQAVESALPNMFGVEKVIAEASGQLVGTFTGRLAEYHFSTKP